MDLLIDRVRKQPCLWDTNHVSYRNVTKRDWTWERVAKESGMANGNEAKSQWKKLRDSHREALRRRKNCPDMKPWKYEDAMRFLLSPSENVETVTFYSNDSNDADNIEGDIETIYETVECTLSTSSPEHESKKNLEKKRRERRHVQQDEMRGEVVCTPKDSLSTLFESLCQKVRKLPKHLQLRVQREMFESVLRAEEEAFCDPLVGCYSPPSSTSVCGQSSTTDTKNT